MSDFIDLRPSNAIEKLLWISQGICRKDKEEHGASSNIKAWKEKLNKNHNKFNAKKILYKEHRPTH